MKELNASNYTHSFEYDNAKKRIRKEDRKRRDTRRNKKVIWTDK